MKSSTLEVRFVVLASVALGVATVACVSEDPGARVSPATCEAYCGEIRAKCTGDNLQYRSNEECMKLCSLLGDLGTTGDGDVGTVGCRLRIAQSITGTPDKRTCVEAGPFGGGRCGLRCASFCKVMAQNCSGTPNPPYDSEATCNEQCERFTVVPNAGEGPPERSAVEEKNDFHCRGHHLILSLGDPNTHCPHTAISSATCFRP